MKHFKKIIYVFVLFFTLFLLQTQSLTACATSKDIQKSTTISFEKTIKSIKAGKTFQYKVNTGDAAGQVTYSVSNTKYATISNDGLFTAKRPGTVKVTASLDDATITTKVKIKAKKIVCIDPGHSSRIPSGSEPVGPGSTTMKDKDNYGTCGIVTKVAEYKTTLTLSKKLKTILENRGYKVVLTRTNNTKAISCADRAKVANKANADIFLRIHVDAIDNSSVTGASGLYPTTDNHYVSKYSKKSKKLTKCILDNMCEKTKAKNRGLFGRDDLTGTNWAQMPVTLIEVGFATNPTEDRTMQKKSYQKKLVTGMANGIDQYFGY